MEKINWPQVLITFLFSIAACFVASMLISKKNYNSQNQLVGTSRPSLNFGNKKRGGGGMRKVA